jgi:hypothetical protein
MKQRRTPEQVNRKLREADRLLAKGRRVPEIAQQLDLRGDLPPMASRSGAGDRARRQSIRSNGRSIR